MSSDALLKAIVDPADATVDIVAVHGLNPFNNSDHAETTWTASNGKLWLKDFLPSRLSEKARIFLFSYNANPAFKSNSEGVHQQANNLLVRLILERDETPDRPLYFICHSLGGLVVKRAIVQAQQTRAYERLLKSIYGLVFFATPHGGGNNASLGEIAASIARSLLNTKKNDYLEALKKNSFFAEALRNDFRNRLDDFPIVTFYENRKTKGVVSVVDRQSAVLGLPDDREMVIGLDADHSAICRFQSEDDPGYRPVWQSVRRLIRDSIAKAQRENDLLAISAPSNGTSEANTVDGLSDLTLLVNLVVTCDHQAPTLSRDLVTATTPDTCVGDSSQLQIVHTAAYYNWVRDASGMLLCVAEEELQYNLPAMLSSIFTSGKREPRILHHDCRSEQPGGANTLTSICLAMIIDNLRFDCLRDGAWDRGRLTEEVRDLVDRGIDFAVVCKALTSRSVTPPSMFEQLAALIRILVEDGFYPVLVIEGLESLDGKTLVRLTRLLSGTIKEGAHALLVGRRTPVLCASLTDVPQVDRNTERQEFLNSLFFEDLHFRRNRVQRAHRGTTKWIFDHPEFQRWEESPSGVLWIQGKPGSGKSVLAKALTSQKGLIRRWPAGVTIANWFYSNRHHKATTMHASMLRSVLYQIQQSNHDLFQIVLPIYRARRPFGAKDELIHQYWDSHDLEQMFASVVTSGVSMVCVIDALDESERIRGRLAFRLLRDITRMVSRNDSSRMKLIILSRPFPLVAAPQDERHWMMLHDEGLHKIVMEDENSADIQRLVGDRMQELEKRMHPFAVDVSQTRNLRDPNSFLSLLGRDEASGLEDMQRYIVENANGVILWAVLVFEALFKICDERSGRVTIQDLKQKLKELPPGLDRLYRRVVEGLKGKDQSLKEEARRIVMVVSAASSIRKISLKALWDAIAGPEQVETTLASDEEYREAYTLRIRSWADFCAILNEWCGPFLEVVYTRAGERHTHFLSSISAVDDNVLSTATVQFLHQSVKEFFADKDASDFLSFTEVEAEDAFHTLCARHMQTQKMRFAKFVEPAMVASTQPNERAQHAVRFFKDQYFLLYLLQAGKQIPKCSSLGYLVDRTIRPQSSWLDEQQYGSHALSRPRAALSRADFNDHIFTIFQELYASESLTATEWVLWSLRSCAPWCSYPGAKRDGVDFAEEDSAETTALHGEAVGSAVRAYDEMLPALLMDFNDERYSQLKAAQWLSDEAQACFQGLEHVLTSGTFVHKYKLANDTEERGAPWSIGISHTHSRAWVVQRTDRQSAGA